jgi:hypothetical protein
VAVATFTSDVPSTAPGATTAANTIVCCVESVGNDHASVLPEIAGSTRVPSTRAVPGA